MSGYFFTNNRTENNWTNTQTLDLDCTAATLWPDYFKSDWLPESCKWEKYLPTWHLVRSYLGYNKIVSLNLPKNESLKDFDKRMEQVAEDSLENWKD